MLLEMARRIATAALGGFWPWLGVTVLAAVVLSLLTGTPIVKVETRPSEDD